MKIIFNKLNLKVLILLGLFFLVVLSGAAYVVGVGTYTEGYRVNTGVGAQNIIIDSGGTCKKVTNTSGIDYFIPTKTTAEWDAFVANKPTGVTIEACCDVASTCSGHGTCNTDGSCSCSTGYTGTSCASCASNYYSYPTCTYCSAATTCSGHGTCTASGTCSCSTGFTGASCASCASGYSGYPNCMVSYKITFKDGTTIDTNSLTVTINMTARLADGNSAAWFNGTAVTYGSYARTLNLGSNSVKMSQNNGMCDTCSVYNCGGVYSSLTTGEGSTKLLTNTANSDGTSAGLNAYSIHTDYASARTDWPECWVYSWVDEQMVAELDQTCVNTINNNLLGYVTTVPSGCGNCCYITYQSTFTVSN